jgi:hypothetical protein
MFCCNFNMFPLVGLKIMSGHVLSITLKIFREKHIVKFVIIQLKAVEKSTLIKSRNNPMFALYNKMNITVKEFCIFYMCV